ncbi:MAG TPA: sugar kinase [Dongiaceae bacterium]
MTGERHIISIGECMMELRHRDEEILALSFGGDTLNTALYMSRLGRSAGLHVSYLTALGDDPYSARMMAAWQAEGIDTGMVARLPGRLPGLYIIRTNAAGERSFSYFRSAAAARDMLKSGRGESLRDKVAAADCIYLSAITLSILDDEQRGSLMAMLDAARAKGGQVAFDSNFRPAGWLSADNAIRWMDEAWRRATIGLPTLDDEQKLHGDAGPEACAARLRALGVTEVAVKLGQRGCYLASATHGEYVAAVAVARPVDTTAAGDSFNAAYIAGRMSGLDPLTSARKGNGLAAIIVQHPGAIVPADAMAGFCLRD